MAPPQTRTVRVVAAKGVKEQYRTLKKKFPEIADTIKIFNANKRQIPPVSLPAKMRDHFLKGKLAGKQECHLADDVLLIYTHKNDLVHMLKICQHADLSGKRGKALKKAVG